MRSTPRLLCDLPISKVKYPSIADQEGHMAETRDAGYLFELFFVFPIISGLSRSIKEGPVCSTLSIDLCWQSRLQASRSCLDPLSTVPNAISFSSHKSQWTHLIFVMANHDHCLPWILLPLLLQQVSTSRPDDLVHTLAGLIEDQ